VTSRGNITQSGALNVLSGASTFTIDTVGGMDVLLGSQANNFAGQLVTINTINGGTVRDVSLRNTDAAAVFPVLPTGLRDLTLVFNNAGVSLPSLTLGRNLIVSAGGLVDFGGPAVSTVNGSLEITTTAGGINDSGLGRLTVSGTGTLTATGAGNDITLNNNNNDFNTIVVNGRDVIVRDANDITFGPPASTAFNLTVYAGGNVNFYSPPISIVLNDLTVTAGGNMTGTLTVNGNRYINVGGVDSSTLGRSMAGLSVINIPLPRLEAVSFTGATIDAEEAAKILPPGSIGVLSLQVPFPPSQKEEYQIEKYSKWTYQGILAALLEKAESPAAE
jgi:hypothetical protein